MHNFEGENTIFSKEGHRPSPDTILVGAFGASIRVSSALTPTPNHIFGYGPAGK